MREISIAIFYKSSQIFIMRNLTDFRKTVETGVDPRLVVPQTFEFASDWLWMCPGESQAEYFFSNSYPLGLELWFGY